MQWQEDAEYRTARSFVVYGLWSTTNQQTSAATVDQTNALDQNRITHNGAKKIKHATRGTIIGPSTSNTFSVKF